MIEQNNSGPARARRLINRMTKGVVLFAMSLTGLVAEPSSVALAAGGPPPSWTIQDFGSSTASLQGITYGNGSWVTEGSGSTIYNSTTETGPWNPLTLTGISPSDAFYSTANHEWLVVGKGGTLGTLASNFAPSSWTTGTSPTTADLMSIATNGATTVVVGAVYGTGGSSIEGDVLASSDLHTFLHPLTSQYGLNNVTYGDNQFVAVGDHGTIYTSPDAVSWSKQTAPVPASLAHLSDPYDLKAVTYGHGQFLAVGTNGTMLTSTDGVTWNVAATSGIPNPSQDFVGVAYGAGEFVVVGNGSGSSSILSSVDNGTTWLQEYTGNGTFQNLTYANGLFAASGYDRNSGVGLMATENAGSNAYLSNIELSQGTLSPSFAYGTKTYTANVPSNLATMTVTPTLANSTATMTVNGNTAPNGVPFTIGLSAPTTTITINVTAPNGVNNSTYTVTVTRQNMGPTITSTTIPSAGIGQAYSAQLMATGSGPFYWTMAGGTLPAGLTLGTTGLISGTPTGSATSSSFIVQAKDANNLTSTMSLSLTITSSAAISTTTLASGVVGVWYSQQLYGTGVGSLTWTMSSGTPPPGLTLSTSGILSGAPTTAGLQTFTVKMTDGNSATATAQISINIATPPTITTTTLPDGVASQSYIQQLAGTGTGTLHWAVSAGGLPSGLMLNDNGAIWGTPTQTGTWSFQVQLTDTTGVVGVHVFSLTVDAMPKITTTSLPVGAVGVAYHQQLNGSATGTLQWTLLGAQPPGLSLSSRGLISGTPTSLGTFTFQVQMNDSVSHLTITQTLSITIVSPPTIVTEAVHPGFVGQAYSTQLTATGSNTSFTWTLAGGKLPDGLSLKTNGSIEGLPTKEETESFTVQVTDGWGLTATGQLSLTIGRPHYTITIGSLSPAVRFGTAYKQTATAEHGTAPYTWSVSQGALPTGLTLNTTTGSISGAPNSSGTSHFTLDVKDAYGAEQVKDFTMTIVAKNQSYFAWNGKVAAVPYLVHGGTAYVPIWYVSQFLKVGDISSRWDGHNWYLTTSRNVGKTSTLGLGDGTNKIFINNKLMARVTTVKSRDQYTRQNTSFIPIWYVMQALSATGLHSTWDSVTWSVY